MQSKELYLVHHNQLEGYPEIVGKVMKSEQFVTRSSSKLICNVML